MNLRRFFTIILMVVLALASISSATSAAPETTFPPPTPVAAETPILPILDQVEGTDTSIEPGDTDLPPDVPADWWSTVQQNVRQSEYHVTWQDQTNLSDVPAAYQAPNRAHNLRTYFTPAGIRVIPRAGDSATWEWALTLTGYGYAGDDDLQPAAPAQLVADGKRIEYRRDGPSTGSGQALVEWYVNDENGLEQGFTINQRPPSSSDQSSELILNLAVSGNLTPNLIDDGQVIEFTTTSGGVRVLRYSDLHAYDATGRRLPAHFSLSGLSISIVVDDENAIYPLTIDPLATSPSWTAESNQTNARFGYSVGTAGDVNGDGYSDVIVGAPWYDSGETDEGGAFVYYGSAIGLSTIVDWLVDGDQTGSRFGFSVGTAGDVNGDGYADVIVGADWYDDNEVNEGAAFVYHGSELGLSTTENWMTQSDRTGAEYGRSVGTAGDVNGDGYTDVIIGARYHDGGETDAGASFVYYGSVSGLSAVADWTVEGDQSMALFGRAVGTAGDVNGDGYADVIVGARNYDGDETNEGRAFVYQGSATGLSTTADWIAEGNQASAAFGVSVGTAGDVNGDGYADVIIGAHFYDNGQTNEGRVYVYHGSATGLGTTVDWTSESDDPNAYFGWSANTAGDVNGDGYADIVVGAFLYDGGEQDEGLAHVYYGSITGLNTTADWTVESDQIGAALGTAVGTAGDVNGDGYSDIIVGADKYNNGQTDEGRVYVYYGGSIGLTNGPAVWTAEGNQDGAEFGRFVRTAGDVNGDNYDDVIIGAPYYDGGQTDEGAAFIFHGSMTGPSIAPDWMAESDQADAEFGFPVGTAGDVDDDGYADVIIGARYYDNDQIDEGRAYVYHGSATGLNAVADWIAEGNQVEAYFGVSTSTAGDVNCDGYADVIVGALRYNNGQEREGRAYVYHGSATGLSATADWMAESNYPLSYFGVSVDTAGDVNGDNCADVIVGAHGYNNGIARGGRAYVYHGSLAGLSPSANWTADVDQNDAQFGYSVSTAGDVNGDNYDDVIVGSPGHDNGETDEGRVYVYHGSATGLSTTPNWTTESNQAGAQLGFHYTVDTAGDVNRDGYSDIIIGAKSFDNGETDEGRAYVYLGSMTGLSDSADWTAESNQDGAEFGSGVGTAGDVNGDGYADIIIGAHYYDGGHTDEGRAYVYYGDPTGIRPSLTNWMAEGNQAGAQFGNSVDTAGDVNGDGYADVIIGAHSYDNGQIDAGAAFVFHGSAMGPSATPDWIAEGDQAEASFGWSVCTAGDVNGDGYADVIIGARYYDNEEIDEGRAYIYHGSELGLSPVSNWMAESDQSNAQFGVSVNTAGDVNGDGYSDVIVGAHYYDNDETDEGRAYVYYGSALGTSAIADWTSESDQGEAHFGYQAETAGDVNGDGYTDVIVGALHYNNGEIDEGRAYVYHGSAAGLNTTADWMAESNQAGARFGNSASTAGDVNGDGYADVIVGAKRYDNGETDEGRAYVYYGSADGLNGTADWIAEGNQNDAHFGRPVSAAGDVNGDGYADVIVGAYSYTNDQSNEGRVYVYHGSMTGLSTIADWTAESDQTEAYFGVSVSTAGDVNGDGYADVIVGANLYDKGETDEGVAFLYYGNGGDGLDVTPRQLRTDGSVHVAPLGISDSETAIQLRLTGRMPMGREQVKLQWQIAPLGTPFTATDVISGASVDWTDTLTTGVVISQNVAGLAPNTPYHWRVRLLYRPGNRMGQPAGRWIHIPWNGWTEQDFRTPSDAYVCSPETRNSDVVLVVDRSGSMNDDGKLADAQAAVSSFLDTLNAPPEQAALVSFAVTATLDAPLTTDVELVRTAVMSLTAEDSTYMDHGLAEARLELASSRHVPTHTKIIILLSDGQQTGDTAPVLAEAAAAKAEGALIFSIGLGPDADADLLQQVASDPAYYFYAPSGDDLEDVYLEISTVLACPDIGGRTFVDWNVDGAYTVGVDEPLGDVDVQLDGNLTLLTTTSELISGTYLFAANPSGHYTLTVDLNSLTTGYQPTTDTVRYIDLRYRDDLDNDFGFLPSSGLTLTKKATPSALPYGGGLVTYTFQVSNTGQTPLSPITVTDPLLGGVMCANPPGQDPLLPGDSFTCQTSTLILTDTLNVALATGTPVGPSGNPVPGATVSATAQVSVLVRPAVGGRVFADWNQDGLYTAGVDTPFPGIEVELQGAQVSDAVTSQSPNGLYLFSINSASVYTLTVNPASVAAGYQATTPVSHTVELTSGNDLDNDFGFYAPSGLALTKTANPSILPYGGGLVTYTFRVSNTGFTSLSPVTVTDPLLGGVVCANPPGQLLPGDSFTCQTSTLILTDTVNVAMATGLPLGPGGEPVPGAVVSDTAQASVTLVWAAIGGRVFADWDQDGLYTAGIDTSLAGVEIELQGTSSGDTATSQSPDGRYLFPTNSLGTYTLTVAPASVPTGYQATTPISYVLELSAQDDLDNDFGFYAPSGLALDKTAKPSTLPYSGGLVTYTFQVSNTGFTSLSPVTVTDPLLGGVVCTNPPGQNPLLPGDSFTCQTSTLILTHTVNVATATGLPLGPGGEPVPGAVVSDTAQASVTLVWAAIGGQVFADWDQDGSYTAGTDTSLPGVEIELQGTSSGDTATSQSPDGRYLFPTNSLGTYTLTVNPASVPTGYQATTPISRVIELSAQDDLDNDFGFYAPSGLALDKTATPSILPYGGGLVTYTFRVSNTGFTSLSPVAVNDPLLGGVMCANPPGQDPLLPGDSFTCQTSTLILADTINVATASGIPLQVSGQPIPSGMVVATDWTAVTLGTLPVLTIDKDTSTPGVEPGGEVTYTIVVRNESAATANEVLVQDSLPSADWAYLAGSVDAQNATRTENVDPQVGDQLLVWSEWTLQPLGVVTLTFQVQVSSTVPEGTYDNTAALDSLETGWIDDEGEVGGDPGTPGGLDPETDEDVTVVPKQDQPLLYLPLLVRNYVPPFSFPAHIGDAIPSRQTTHQGEVFYATTIRMPENLPDGGHFYLSSQPDVAAEVVVDDAVTILSNGTQVFTYTFSDNGAHPQPAIVQVPRATMEALAGQMITVEYRDVYAVLVSASEMWLIWLP